MTTATASQPDAVGDVASPVRVGELVAGKYVVERTLGVGGMGVVIAARDRVLERPVAIKFLLPKLAGSETSVQRFVREARAATRVTSEHVVRLLEIDKLPSGTPFFVMEYLEGTDLRALLRERGPLAPSLAVDYVLQALQAVAEGHTKGIVHRDLKPGNLLLTARADGTPLIKVLDFGIAKTLESNAAESTALTSSDDVRLGSPAYMPPEQLQNPRDVDTRSDIWSLGATLYELLCGRPPFEGSGYLELATRVLGSAPTPLSEQQLERSLPPGLEQVILKCLQKERALRYANAAELASALAPFGSEDARVSLTRVKGMWESSALSSLPNHQQHDSGSVATALSVRGRKAADGVSTATVDQRRTRNIGPLPAPQRGRSWLVVAGACAVVALVLALRAGAPEPDLPAPPAIAAARPPAVAAARPPAIAAARPPTIAVPEPGLTPLQASLAPSAERASATKPAAAAPRRAPSRPASPPPRLSPSAPPPHETVPATDETAVPPLPGRSPEIERLIERRR